MKKHINILLIIIGVFGCKDKSPNYEFVLSEVDSISYKIGYDISFFPKCIQYYESDNDTSLYVLNEFNNGIYKYTYDKYEQKPTKFLFPVDGPKGVGKLDGFYLHNKDTLFTIAKYHYKICLHSDFSNNSNFNCYSLIPGDSSIISSLPLGETSMSP